MMNSQKSKDDGPGMPDGDPSIYDPNFKDQIDKKKDDTKGEKKATLTDGVAPPEEQTLENAIKFNWKNKSWIYGSSILFTSSSTAIIYAHRCGL